MMEFGALQCVPKNPNCTNCVLAKSCIAFKSGKVNTLPVKQMIKQVRIRFFNYLVLFIELDGSKHYYLHHRNGKDIWKGLFDFPLIETESAVDFNSLKMQAMWKQLSLKQGYEHQSTSEEYRHQLTHQSIRAWFHCVQIKESVDGLNKKNVLLVDQKQLERYPVPKLIERFMTDYKLLKTTTLE
jgi:A/G-specific adenine glycosylase